MYCKACGYNLQDLACKCSECGWPFDRDDATTFAAAPPSVILQRLAYASLMMPVGWVTVLILTIIDPYVEYPSGRYAMEAELRLYFVMIFGSGLGVILSIIAFCAITLYEWVFGS